ncbi:hypothetical protein X777_14631 [Ooceraea biroi]|uniref:Uncharacterized protein n=1 Tax=Ooceraea biroi TaxID=2015173 RepID=A0A026WX35_OOCBI|nr:hypothetical protein X777_14631 [Ooceraea biroi]
MAHPVVENLAARAKLQAARSVEEITVFPVRRARTLARIIDRAIESPITVVANQRFSNDNESARSPSDFRAEPPRKESPGKVDDTQLTPGGIIPGADLPGTPTTRKLKFDEYNCKRYLNDANTLIVNLT